MGRKRVEVMNTSFRDGFQSVYGARVFTKDFLPAVEAARAAGIEHFETGGGARFQSLVFYCNENPFEVMDTFRNLTGPNVNLQSLARGVNVVGLESQSSEIIQLHARLFRKHGITTVRNFDALNDVDNLIFSGRCIVEAGLRHEVTVTMMELPPGAESQVHSPEYYVGVLRQILDADIPFHSICFKDASGTSTPDKVYRTIRAARRFLPAGTSIRFHTHESAGISVMAYKAALDSGADGIDLAMAPVSGGTSQPDIVTMWHALRGTHYDLGVDVHKVIEAEKVFKECMKSYFTPPESRVVEPLIPYSPVPGGALAANSQMMRDNGVLDSLSDVIEAMAEVVARGGFGTSVTPVSQFYFQQAFNNVLLGPWKKVADGYGKMVLGYFGRTPAAPDPEIVKLASEQLGLAPTTKHPLELNDGDPKKGIAAARKMLEAEGLPVTDENLFIAATCREKGVEFLKGAGKTMVRKDEPARSQEPTPPRVNGDAPPGAYAVTLGGRTFHVLVDKGRVVVDGQETPCSVEPEPLPKGTELPPGPTRDILSPLPGQILRLAVTDKQHVKAGQTVLVLEAMKMETEVKAPAAGTVTLFVRNGDHVKTGQRLATVH